MFNILVSWLVLILDMRLTASSTMRVLLLQLISNNNSYSIVELQLIVMYCRIFTLQFIGSYIWVYVIWLSFVVAYGFDAHGLYYY